jgi:hypothetical protein
MKKFKKLLIITAVAAFAACAFVACGKKAEDTATEEELIADGQIFTGKSMDLYAPEGGGDVITVKELNQGGWADEETGEIYTKTSDDKYTYKGDKGSTRVSGDYFDEHDVGVASPGGDE